jgi:nitroimidazol reductase NimA-like FMN-containing flavoprotein (pyridoxamine 5'-phosphate oxidase superfamily)
MTDPTVEMGRERVDQFLGTSGTGVLSLSTSGDEPPHSVPVSYGYDSEDGVFYFRLAVGRDSEKGTLAGRQVAFVTYGAPDDRWESVVARGTLTDTEAEGSEALAGLERTHIPLVDIFGQRPGTVEFEFVRLVPDELTGRSESSTGD